METTKEEWKEILIISNELKTLLNNKKDEVIFTKWFKFVISDEGAIAIYLKENENYYKFYIYNTKSSISINQKYGNATTSLKRSKRELKSYLKNEKEKENDTTFECRENLAGKKDILNYLDWKINTWEKSLRECEAMDNKNTFKQQHIARESGIVQELKEVRSFIKFSLKK